MGWIGLDWMGCDGMGWDGNGMEWDINPPAWVAPSTYSSTEFSYEYIR